MIADPYPVIDPVGDLTPIVNVTFFDVGLRTYNLNLDDPQPPGYAYRLPLQVEYDPWVERRDQVVEGEAYKPWNGAVDPFPVTQTQQGISYYEGGLWFHVGGSVYCWCSDPQDKDGDRVFRGGSRFSYAHSVREACQLGFAPDVSLGYIGYRLVRGPVA